MCLKKLIIYTGFLIMLIPKAYSVPSITTATWSGGLDHNTSITLTGTGFTTKSSTGSQVYEHGDGGTFESWWASTNDASLVTVSTGLRHSNNSYVQHLDFVSGSSSARLEGEGTEYEKWACSGFFKFESNFDWGTSGFEGGDQWLSNVKGPWRLWETGGSLENWYLQYAGDENRLKLETEGVTPIQQETVVGSWRTNYEAGEWQQFEFISQDSTLNTADGRITIWRNGAEVFSDSTVETRTSDSVFKRIHTMGFNDSWGVGADAEGDQAPNEYWADDFYCDNEWNAVFVSTSSTFSAGGFREYGVITAWSTTEITFDLWEGSFNTGTDTLYVYVRDSAGVVNASGLELGGDGGGDGGGSVSQPGANGAIPKGDYTIEGGAVFH